MPVPERADHETVAIYAVTQAGARLGRVLARELGGKLFVSERFAAEFGAASFPRLVPFVAQTYSRYARHVFITAAGIAVRAVAPLLRGKDRDPAVVAVDQRGRYAVSLVSGHLGGANDLARAVAAVTAGQAVVTTATDTEDLPSLDTMAQERGLGIANLSAVKDANIALLSGAVLQVFDPDDWLGLRDPRSPGLPDWSRHFAPIASLGQWRSGAPGVVVTHTAITPQPGMLVLNPPCLAVGVGCRRGVSQQDIQEHLRAVFQENGLALGSILGLGSIVAKNDEEGLLAAAADFGVGLFFYESEELSAVDAPNPSQRVIERMGVPSVCEAAAMLLAGAKTLLVQKTKSDRVTVAVAQVP